MAPTSSSDEPRFRCVVQRVSQAEVRIGGESRGAIGAGLVVLFGVGTAAAGWTPSRAAAELMRACEARLRWLADKLLALRIFEDDAGKMNLALTQLPAGGLYLVSQFTLFGDASAGNRPSFTAALRPEFAQPLYDRFVAMLAERISALPHLCLRTGVFGAEMQLSLTNDGPVTLILER